MVVAFDGVATKCDNNRVFDFYFGKDLITYEMKNLQKLDREYVPTEFIWELIAELQKC